MSVQELRVRIDKLSTEIVLQRELLRKLEEDKSLIQRQLNSVLDPVARLPLEISSEIFLCCLPPRPEAAAHHFPMLLLKICNAWTSIALSTPALWASIGLVFPCAEGFEEGVSAWLRRACNRPLSVSLRGQLDGGVAPIIRQHGERLKHLEICDDDEHREYDDEESTIDLMGGISFGPLPLLETLTMRAFEYGREFSGTQILDLLRSAPNLTEASCRNVNFTYMYSVVPGEKLVLPALHRLIFGESAEGPDPDYGILRCLTLPALETLSVSLDNDGFFPFLKRSSPPLQELILAYGEYSFPFAECLRLVPTLARFTLLWPRAYLVAEFFAALAESPSPIVPNLHSLTIHLNSSTITDSSWKTLLRALSARRTQLQVVHIGLIYGSPDWVLEPDIRAEFRQLVADGMQVYVGMSADDLNFLLD
ncbi:hypothetical protein B0H13DRAFT_1119480 [Mycena leptocephala]|nr:hypothetical protein B0H13DRAFT_1119480 [Mycena leptocephala]